MTTCPTSSKRDGFTLIELLVTIGVIAVLAAILTVALGQAGAKARESATAALIKKVSGQVQERLENVDRLKSQPQWAEDARGDTDFVGLSLDQAKIMLLKKRMKIALPQTFSEFSLLDNPEYLRMTASYNSSKHDVNTESAELLYYALTNGKVFGIPTVDVGTYKASEVQDTDGDGLMEFVDAWQRPLRFYRWPTRLIRPGGTSIDRSQGANVLILGLPPAATPDPLAVDQDDPTLLVQPTTTTAATNFEQNYHTPQTYHHFLIVSAGPDGQSRGSGDAAFGLYDPTNKDATKFGYLAQPIMTQDGFDALTDNITNRNRP